MADRTLADISEKMRDIDFCMLTTHVPNGAIASRPMSNNREVDYDGDSFFFAYDSAHMIGEIDADPQVALTFQGRSGLFGTRPFFAAIEGRAELSRDKDRFKTRWTSGLDRWFPQGIDTPGLVLIQVRASNVHYWDGEDEGTLHLARTTA
jgi:general stress protein 26